MSDNQPSQATNNKQAPSSRRKMIQALIVSGAIPTAYCLPSRWTRPVVDTVILPTHAQTTTTPPPAAPIVMASGANNIAMSIDQPDRPGQHDILDWFIGPAYAGTGDLVGGCLTLTIDGLIATAVLVLKNSISDTKTGTVSGTGVSVGGLHGGYSVVGTLNTASTPTSASGTVSGFGESGSFSVSTSNPPCTPIAPPFVCGDSIGATISNNHGGSINHSITVPFADVQAGVGKTYQLGNSQGHFHDVVVSSAHMATLLTGTAVVITSSTSPTAGEHTHNVTLRCGTAF